MRPGPGRWTVPLRATPPDARGRLVVAPHAGSGPHALGALVERLPADIEVVGVVLPGREHRLTEPVRYVASDPPAVVGAVLAELDALPPLPTALFGHSLGAALVGSLSAARPGAFVHAVLSALPCAGSAAQRAGRWSDEELLAMLRRGGITPEAILLSRVWRMHVLDRLRADLTLACRLAHLDAARWCDTPVTLLAGDRDDIAPAERARRLPWRVAPRIRVLPGEHFYLLDEQNLAPVAAELTAPFAGTPFAGRSPARDAVRRYPHREPVPHAVVVDLDHAPDRAGALGEVA